MAKTGIFKALKSLVNNASKGVSSIPEWISNNPRDVNINILRALSIPAGMYAGSRLADFENEHFIKDENVKRVAKFLDTYTLGAIAPLLIAKGDKRILGLKELIDILGLKQMGLVGVDTIANYTNKQNEISKNMLDTALANLQTSNNQKELSQKWLDFTNKYSPYVAGGLGAALAAALGLYAYNSLRKNKSSPDNVSFEIPSEKLSPKFYTQLGREILFKDKDEENRIKPKDKFLIEDSENDPDSQNKVANYDNRASTLNPDVYNNAINAIGPTTFMRNFLRENKQLSPIVKWSVLSNAASNMDKNLDNFESIVKFALPIVMQSLGLIGSDPSYAVKSVTNNPFPSGQGLGDLSSYYKAKQNIAYLNNPFRRNN